MISFQVNTSHLLEAGRDGDDSHIQEKMSFAYYCIFYNLCKLLHLAVDRALYRGLVNLMHVCTKY